MTDDKTTLKLDWQRAIDGSMFARTASVGGWMIVVSDYAISIVATSVSDQMTTLRTKKDQFEALLEAEAFVRMHVLNRFGALLT